MQEKYSPRSDDPWIKEKEKKNSTISKIIDFAVNPLIFPTTFLILTSIAYYIYICRYYSAFFESLSIPYTSLNLPFTFYLSAGLGILPLMIIIPLVLLFPFIIYDLYLYYKTFKILFGVAYPVCADKSEPIDSSKAAKQLNKVFLNRPKNRKIIVYIIGISLLMFFYYYPSIQGSSDARNLIEGKTGSYHATLELKDNNIRLDNKSLILVMCNENKYYLVEKNSSATKHVKSYIIPDSEVKMATLSIRDSLIS